VKKQPWSEAEIAALVKHNPRTAGERRKLFPGRSAGSVNCKQRELGLTAPEPKGVPANIDTTLEEDSLQAQDLVWKGRFRDLDVKYQRAVKVLASSEQLMSEFRSAAPRSYNPAPSIVKSTRKAGKGSPQSAVLLLSDTHVGKVVTPEQTLGMGRYDFPTFLARLKFAEESVLSILQDHTTTEVPELVIAMLGDMLDGGLNHGVEAGQRNTRFSQFYGAGHAIAQFVRNLAAAVPKVRIYTVQGNHTRWDFQARKMPTENRFSNLDTFLYAYVEALTKDLGNVKFHLDQQPFTQFSVAGWRFYGLHGDTWRGGDKALGIPNHAIGRQLSTTTQLAAKTGHNAPHYYVSGHLHRSITVPHALGSVIINGGFPGLDNYALASNFNPADPVQRFFLVHPKFGKSAEYELSLKYAEVGDKPPYQIPEGFDCE
jgi:hypothetical protein